MILELDSREQASNQSTKALRSRHANSARDDGTMSHRYRFISVLRRSSVKIVKWLASASHPLNPGLWLAALTYANFM